MLKQKVLIVDDDENIAELISLYLEKEQYDTETAGSGEEALQIIEVYNPDLILLDIMLPGIDGYETCQQIRKKMDVPIIMLSAKGEVFDKVLGLKMGADDYIVKPFDSNEMIARVSAVLRRSGTSKSEEPSGNTDLHIQVNSLNMIILISTYQTTLLHLMMSLLKCLRRSWSFFTSSLLIQIRYLPEISFLTSCGDMTL